MLGFKEYLLTVIRNRSKRQNSYEGQEITIETIESALDEIYQKHVELVEKCIKEYGK